MSVGIQMKSNFRLAKPKLLFKSVIEVAIFKVTSGNATVQACELYFVNIRYTDFTKILILAKI